MQEFSEVVSKSKFAEMRGVTPGRVSQWLSEGKIGPEALVGEGRGAKINVAVAVAQLQERLDPSQRFGLNGIMTKLDLPTPSLQPAAAPPPVVVTVEDQIKREKLRQAQLQTARLEEEDRLHRGVYIFSASAREEMTKIAARLFDTFDGALPDFASAIAAKHQLPHRDVLHLLRGEMRRVRARAAAEFAALADTEPEMLDDESHRDTPARVVQ